MDNIYTKYCTIDPFSLLTFQSLIIYCSSVAGNTRKNHPLCHEVIRWKSDVPLTEGQLRSKRDEFWDTAPAFEGRKEIWDALRAAAVAAEQMDYELAQAILDGASVSVPNGYLTECYDELGARYQVSEKMKFKSISQYNSEIVNNNRLQYKNFSIPIFYNCFSL